MTIEEIIETFDTYTKTGFNEHDISLALKRLIPQDKTQIDDMLKAELMAFEFSENYHDEKTGWGTYFGPMIVWNNLDGTAIESPSITLITPEMINYWEKRATSSVNPIIIARYSGLVCYFKNKVTEKKPSYQIREIYIKAIIDQADGDFHKYEVHTFRKLAGALQLAISLNHNELIKKCKDSLINFEHKHSQDTKPGLWGHTFDNLVGNKRINISDDEESNIIKELEEKLSRLTTANNESQKIDPWAAEAAAERLALYYKKNKKYEDVKRVVLKIGIAFDKIIEDTSPIQASIWLQHLHKLYLNFNLKEEAAKVLLRIRELGPKSASELEPISHSFEIPKEEIDKIINKITSGDIQEILQRITLLYIPIKEQVKDQIFNLYKKAPLPYIMGSQFQDEKGRVVATIGSLEDDLEGHIIIQVSQNLSFSSFFLRSVFQESIHKKGLCKEQILKFIENSPIINNDRLEIINRGLDAYFEDDFLISIHLLVPQIEEAIRNIIEFMGGNVLKPSKSGGGYHLRTFDEILRDDIIKKVLGEDTANYFRILFTDQRGWNIRNIVCHGMASPNMFNYEISDRIIHAFLCLGLIKKIRNYEK
ncbi:DUF4209 domain-containing protein [Flavobacterium sp. B17]|uniref:DUF4209 domain-containing protein n=1 Tax=Flavobacterium sp. B17 TaxID=95618 RepID=UPI00034CEBFA|nr:DUF4209 domain-containing protein [Flavobacterium sp. B17]